MFGQLSPRCLVRDIECLVVYCQNILRAMFHDGFLVRSDLLQTSFVSHFAFRRVRECPWKVASMGVGISSS